MLRARVPEATQTCVGPSVLWSFKFWLLILCGFVLLLRRRAPLGGPPENARVAANPQPVSLVVVVVVVVRPPLAVNPLKGRGTIQVPLGTLATLCCCCTM